MSKQIIFSIGRLVSTTDMDLARKIGQVISLDEITGGKPSAARTVEEGNQQHVINGEFYELERVAPTLENYPLMYEQIAA